LNIFKIRTTCSSGFLKILKELVDFTEEPTMNQWFRVGSLTWFFDNLETQIRTVSQWSALIL
jgi:hypothetical protein